MAAVLNTICRGVVGYISYLATCNSSSVYSEYLLYEPILRIAKSQGYSVRCEYSVRTLKKERGSTPKVDFLLDGSGGQKIAIEVKWAKARTISVEKDIEKLKELYAVDEIGSGFLLVFGSIAVVENLRFSGGRELRRLGRVVTWNAGRTNYAAASYVVT